MSDSEVPADGPVEPLTRREAIRRIGGGGATLFGAGIVAGAVGGHTAAHAATSTDQPLEPSTYQPEPGRVSAELPVGDAAGRYGGPYHPPEGTPGDRLDSVTFPTPASDLSGRSVHEIELDVVEQEVAVSRGFTIPAWTYGGTVPGPTIRATEGDTIRVRLRNRTDHDHNLHFHGRHSPLHDGWEPIPPGGETIYEIVAGPTGVHPYHCHTMPIDHHIARGLYGTLIVDPMGGRSPAIEVMLQLGGFDPELSGRNQVYAWNGIAGFYELFPIKVEAGAPIRTYVVNMTEYEPVGSFHLHAQTFDVFPTGIGSQAAWHGDVVTLGQMERAMLEFTLPERGRYMFHPHQHHMAGRGAMGWFAAI